MVDISCGTAEFLFALDKTVAILKDAIVAGAAIVGGYVALKGLGTWNRQHQGQNTYNLTRTTLIALSHYLRAIDSARSPVISAAEMWAGEDELKEDAQGKTYEQKRILASEKVYYLRWKRVEEARPSLELGVNEAEALWGDGAVDLMGEVLRLEQDLLNALIQYLQFERMPNLPSNFRNEERLAEIGRIAIRSLDRSPDKFGEQFTIAAKKLETYFRSKYPRLD